MWAIIVWLVLGGIAGWLASKIMGTDGQMGIPANILVGIIGAMLGGWLLRLFHLSTGSSTILSILTAVLGACLLLWIVGMLTGRR